MKEMPTGKINGIEIYGKLTSTKLFTIGVIECYEFYRSNFGSRRKPYNTVPIKIGPDRDFVGKAGIAEVSNSGIAFSAALTSLLKMLYDKDAEQIAARMPITDKSKMVEKFDKIVEDSVLYGEKRFEYLCKSATGIVNTQMKEAYATYLKELEEEAVLPTESPRCGIGHYDPNYEIPGDRDIDEGC